MTLLELLRQELPKHGGWPEGVAAMAQDADGAVQNYADTRDIRINYEFAHGNSRIAHSYSIDSGECEVSTDRLTAIVTREEYEASGWDGKGLPPVGTECEIRNCGEWFAVVIKFVGDKWVVADSGEFDGENCYEIADDVDRFRPIRTEAERAIDEMVRLSGVSTGAAKILYDAGYRK
ncbi:hypothetical protein [Staphylococcus aureus]|uniref:hypothetical protein n=1 Tax=Staphylococcus aureus TaxID=1280 RepID=UPI002E19978D|nr:hypothetical protein [Staphylococcus aureus]